MLIWINGPNGIGKTQVAFELRHRVPGSLVVDPEHLGFGIRRTLPEPLRTDFRELPLWREGTLTLLREVLEHTEAPVIVPMTVLDPSTLEEILDPLRADGHRVVHMALLASERVLRRRIRGRGESARGFAAQQGRTSLAVLRSPRFEHHLDTGDLTIGTVAERVAERAGVPTIPDPAGPLRRRMRRLGVHLRHIRFD